MERSSVLAHSQENTAIFPSQAKYWYDHSQWNGIPKYRNYTKAKKPLKSKGNEDGQGKDDNKTEDRLTSSTMSK